MINIKMQQPPTSVQKLSPAITVLGVGGAGGNAVNNMIAAGLQGCSFVVCNTDAQALDSSLSENKIQLGTTVTGGLGAGAKPEVGRCAAEETLDDVMRHLEGANMAFITAGMGGGTGTGAAPVIAKACRDMGILTVGVVTKPFHFEGTTRMKQAEVGIDEMQQYVDTLIVIPNQNLFRVANEKTTFAEAFKMADSVLQSGVRGVTDLMVMPGLINLDFADIRSVMLEMGKAMMGTGEAEGERRAIEAAESAINNPLLDDVSMKGAQAVIINVTGGFDMTLMEVDEACNRIREEVDPDANIIFGSIFDETIEGVMRVSIVATGIDVENAIRKKPTSAVTVNAITNIERKPERAQPRTEVEVPAPAAATEYTAPAMPQVTPQPQPVSGLPGFSAPPVAPPLPLGPTADEKDIEVSATPKATVYRDSFIPPKPVEPETAPFESLTAPSLSATKPQAETRAEPILAPGLDLKPPVPGASAQQKKRPPSLFERFTNPLRSHQEPESDEGKSGDTGGSGTAGVTPQKQTERQGNLNIDVAPSADSTEDELDIPAFLRRQAN